LVTAQRSRLFSTEGARLAKAHTLLSLRHPEQAGMFDWSETALSDSGLTNLQKSFRMSDHYPLWVEFEVP
jgi:hypothetical protein